MVDMLDVVNCGALFVGLLQHPQIPGSRLLVCGEFYYSKRQNYMQSFGKDAFTLANSRSASRSALEFNIA